MKLWPVDHFYKYICPHFLAWLLLYSAITSKREDKNVVKVVNWSEFQLSEMTLLQNPYFSTKNTLHAATIVNFNRILLLKYSVWRRPALSMHIINFPSKCAPIFCKHTCNINPFLYINDQFALKNIGSKPRKQI